jgi:hypothetical protein
MRPLWLLVCAGCGVEPLDLPPNDLPPSTPVHVVNLTTVGPMTGTDVSLSITPPSPDNRILIVLVHESDAYIPVKRFAPMATTGGPNGCGRSAQSGIYAELMPPPDVIEIDFAKPTTFALWALELTSDGYVAIPSGNGGIGGDATAQLHMLAGQVVVSYVVGCSPPILTSTDFTGGGVMLDSQVTYAEVVDNGPVGANWQTAGSWRAMTFGITSR